MMPDDGLRAAVEAQALARTRGDLTAFASYMEPQAIVQLRHDGERSWHAIRPHRYEVVELRDDGDSGVSIVRFRGRGAYEMHQRWKRTDGRWKAVEADVPDSSVRAGWLGTVARVLRPWHRAPTPPARKELE
jgi:hypothetical protein